MRSRQKVRSVFNKYQHKTGAKSAILGNGGGIVDVPDKKSFVYARIEGAPAIPVLNHRVPSINNLRVWVGYDPLEPKIFQVLSIRTIQQTRADGQGQSLLVPIHGTSHLWQQRDPVYSDLRQMFPFRPRPNGLSLEIYQGITYMNDTWIGVTGQAIDLTPYIPATGARYVEVHVNTSQVLEAQSGNIKDLNSLYLSDTPPAIPGTIPIAAVRLWAGMSGIYEAPTATDIADLRWRGLYNGTTGVAGGSGDVNGPASAVVDDLASFSSVSGKIIKDSGVKSTDVVVGPGSALDGHLALFDGATGKLIKDGGLPSAGSLSGPATTTDHAIARWDGTSGSNLQNSSAVLEDDGDINLATGSQYLVGGSQHTHSATNVISDTMAAARLGSGTPDNTKFLRGDSSWQVPPGGLSGLTPAKMVYATASDAIATEADLYWLAASNRLGILGSPSSNLHDFGSLGLYYTNPGDVASYNVLDTDCIIYCDSSTGTTINLPALSGRTGRVLVIVNGLFGYNVVIDGAGSETINGATTYTLDAQWEAVWIMALNAFWLVIGKIG